MVGKGRKWIVCLFLIIYTSMCVYVYIRVSMWVYFVCTRGDRELLGGF